MAFAQDLLTRIINVHAAPVDQQGLIAEYPYNTDDGLGVPIATAESGEAFSGVAMGASGLGYTVLTKGLVCFGKPRDGAACFMAAADFDIGLSFEKTASIKRGALDEDGKLKWEPAGGGKGLVALTFAGKAFHAVYLEDKFMGATRIETSFDGKTWNGSLGFPAETLGGAVAYNGTSYASAGEFTAITAGSDPSYTLGSYGNLAWATATAPAEDGAMSLGWSSGSINGIDDNPGSQTGAGIIAVNGACTVAGGRGSFVAATYDKNKIVVEIPSGGGDTVVQRQVILQTAAAAHSTRGNSWSNTELSGVTNGFFEFSSPGGKTRLDFGGSMSTAVIYVRKREGAGYFLCAAHSSTTVQLETNDPGTTSRFSTLHRSDDGQAWSTMRTKPDCLFFTLSAIARNLAKTTIVTL